jgi:hypothetical protein
MSISLRGKPDGFICWKCVAAAEMLAPYLLRDMRGMAADTHGRQAVRAQVIKGGEITYPL